MNTLKMLKTIALLAALVFSGSTAALAQTDVSKKIRKLPNQDGTHLLHQEKGFDFFAVKQDGKVVEIIVKDKEGNLVRETETEEGKGTTVNAKKASGSGAGAPRPNTVSPGPCPSGPDQICRWNTTFKSCICIYTGPLK